LRLLITGASGFLGSAVAQNFSVKSRQNTEVLLWDQGTHGSLLSQKSRDAFLDEHQPDTVLHLAWQSTRSPSYEMNSAHHDWTSATIDFATECSERGIRFFCAGSAIDERQSSSSHLASSSYLESKQLLRDHFEAMLQSQTKLTWLQIQYVFSLSALRPRLLRAIVESESPPNFQPDNPESLHDFVHVDDVASAIAQAVSERITGRISIGTGLWISVADFVEAVKFQCGYRETRPIVTLIKSITTGNVLQLRNWSPIASYRFLGIEASE
jgi:nucleoside-diphosphate-sugar epimerase